jgi:hypothetical protein
VTGAIVGARDAAQVDGWIDAATLQFSAEDLGEIVRALGRIGAGLWAGGTRGRLQRASMARSEDAGMTGIVPVLITAFLASAMLWVSVRRSKRTKDHVSVRGTR